MKRGQQQNNQYGTRRNGSQSSKVVELLYPIVAYFASCQIVNLLIGMLPFADQIDAVKRQGLGALLGCIVLYLWFVRGMEAGNGQKRQVIAGLVIAALMLGCAGVAMNNVLAWTGFTQLSDTYQTVEQAFYSSSLGWEILSLGIITPIAEEVLYRYIVFYKLRSWQGRTTAIIGTALIFGLIHMNLVQTVYAFVLGLALGVLMECYQDVRVAICGHIVANILSLLRGETGFLSWLQPGNDWFGPVTLGLLVTAGALAIWCVGKFKKE